VGFGESMGCPGVTGVDDVGLIGVLGVAVLNANAFITLSICLLDASTKVCKLMFFSCNFIKLSP